MENKTPYKYIVLIEGMGEAYHETLEEANGCARAYQELGKIVQVYKAISDEPQAAPNVLKLAEAIIYGDREKTYGHPAKNLLCIADYWNQYLKAKLVGTAEMVALDAADVAKMMVLLKIARLHNRPDHRDSVVDGIGYFALLDRIGTLK